MKTILLMRHAKSDWNNNLSDHQRPLNSRGKHDAPRMADEIIRRGLIPELILSSDSQRTKDTLNLMRNSFPESKIEFTPALYLASAQEIKECICRLNNQFNTVLVLAHNPGITDVFYTLANCNIDNVPTAGAGCIRFDVEKFSDIQNNKGDLEYFIYPKMLD